MASIKRLVSALAIPLLAVAIVGCDDDNGTNNPPRTGTLTGQIIFHGEWPDSGNVQLSLFDNWDATAGNCVWCPAAAGGPPDHYTPAFQNPDTGNTGDPDTVNFTLTGISLGTYQAVAMGWRSPTQVGDINCTEPVVGLYGATPSGPDSLPDPVTFTDAQPNVSLTVHAYLDRLPVPGCNNLGRIEGTVNLQGEWPDEGVAVILTTMPWTAWQPGGIAGYRGRYVLAGPDDTHFRFTPTFGTYYLSAWVNVAPPDLRFLGAHGLNLGMGGDASPDPVTITANQPLVSGVAVNANAPHPHWISGTINFTGQRPAEGMLVMVTNTPVTPASPPAGPPAGFFFVRDTTNVYVVSGLNTGTYYVSLWKNDQNPQTTVFYGAYGYDAAQGDMDPDPVTINTTANWGRNGIDIQAAPPPGPLAAGNDAAAAFGGAARNRER